MTGTDLVTVERALDTYKPRFDQVLGTLDSHLTSARLIRTVLIQCETNPKLLQCSQQSLFNAAMSAAVLGLEVDGVTGQAFLIPFNSRSLGRYVQLVIGYKGYNTLGARSGLTITGEVVRDGDRFEFDTGRGFVSHVKSLDGKPDARIIAAWAKAASNARPPVVTVLSIAEILAVMNRSPAVKNKAQTPWLDPAIGFPAMAAKTAKRRLAASLPLNVFQAAAALETAHEERGLYAYIDPAKGVIAEPEGAGQPDLDYDDPVETRPDAPASPSPVPPADAGATLSERLQGYDRDLMTAAQQGAAALETLWAKVPLEFKASLESAYKRRYLPTAKDVAPDQKEETP